MDQADRGSGRALVPVASAAGPRAGRPMAGFLTQLIACHHRVPAYRQVRRADPGFATARYGAVPVRCAATYDSDA